MIKKPTDVPPDVDRSRFCTFYIARHGETDWNAKHLVQGQTDIPLNENGRIQIKNLAQELKDITFDVAFSSDLLRAKHTAEAVVLEEKLAVQTTELLRERNFGELEGKPSTAIRTFYALLGSLTDEQRKTHRLVEGYENDEELATRLVTFIRETAITHPGKTVFIATHGGAIRILLIHIAFATYKEFGKGFVNNTGYVKLLSDGVDFFVEETQGINIGK